MATSQEDSKQSSDESYERAERQAKALFNQGFHLGGATRATRDQLHER
ncbi:MAG TPA: hypothetical protein VG759_11595 [Candidatus Angelobacter sp.]|nr:hypothetical protein [Candidatus Angelobacter sp.]